MNAEDFKKTFATASTEKLLDIIDNKHEYTELAVKIAIEELASRNLSKEEIKNYKDGVEAKVTTVMHNMLLNDLSLFHKNVFYFLWLPLLTFAIKQNFREDGYYLKIKQANYFSAAGLAVLVLAGFLSLEFNLSGNTVCVIWILGFMIAYAFDEKFNRQQMLDKLKAQAEQQKKKEQDAN